MPWNDWQRGERINRGRGGGGGKNKRMRGEKHKEMD